MTDEIQGLSEQLATDPDSLAFLPLGEVLRRRGRLDAALAVALGGVHRYPGSADAHDLLGRVRSDRGEGDQAFDSWTQALRLNPEHAGALRGLAFLAFRAGDLERADRHLTRAVELAPTDAPLRGTLDRIRAQRRQAAPKAPGAAFPGDAPGLLLVDGHGRRLAGSLARADGEDVSDTVSAQLAGVSHEAERAARLLALGAWRGLAVEAGDGRLHLLPPTAESLLLLRAELATPAARLALQAERAGLGARRWLEGPA